MKNGWKVMLAGVAVSSILFVASTVEAASYTVEKGDTLTKIAKAHNTTIQQLKQWNNLSNDQIYIQQKLIIASINKVTPTNKTTTTKDNVKENINVEKKTVIYVVAKGDNLTKIAKQYNTSVNELKQWNGLKSDAISVGQQLMIEQNAKLISQTNKPSNIGNVDGTKAVENVEPTIQFKETADEAIARKLASEKEITSSISAATASKYEKLLLVAEQALGIPYKYSGSTIEGFDCSGFVSYVYNSVGVNLTRKSSLMYFEEDTTKVKNPLPGDVVFFKNTIIPTISHMGIYIGNDEFIHAGTNGIAIANLNTKYWSERFVAFKRLNALQ